MKSYYLSEMIQVRVISIIVEMLAAATYNHPFAMPFHFARLYIHAHTVLLFPTVVCRELCGR